MNTHENLMTAVGVLAAVHALLSGLVLGKVNLGISLEAFLGISIAVNLIILILAIVCYNTKTM